MKILITLFVLLFSSNLYSEEGIRVWGRGGEKCYEYLVEYEKVKEIIFDYYEEGVGVNQEDYMKILKFDAYMSYYFGFASSKNLNDKDSLPINNDMPVNHVVIGLYNYCKDNPSKYLVAAMLTVYRSFR